MGSSIESDIPASGIGHRGGEVPGSGGLYPRLKTRYKVTNSTPTKWMLQRMKGNSRPIKIAMASVSLAVVLLILAPMAAIFFFYYLPTTSDAFANAVLRTVTIVAPAPNQSAAAKGRLAVSGDKLAQLKRGEYSAVDGRELIALRKRPRGFLFLTISPDDLQGMQLDDQFFLMRKFIDAAIRLKVDAVVDASMGDHLHTYPEGLKMAEDLRERGIKRLEATTSRACRLNRRDCSYP